MVTVLLKLFPIMLRVLGTAAIRQSLISLKQLYSVISDPTVSWELKMDAIWNEIAKVAKAIASGLAALVGTIVLALDLQPLDHQGIQFLTQANWGIIVLAVLASYGITWRVPNRT